jgi:branched-chain amino acid transport system ATP-binding protein
MGILLVEHHMDLVMSLCDRIVVLNFGQVIADGTPAVIRSHAEVTAAYLGEDVNKTSTMSMELGDA